MGVFLDWLGSLLEGRTHRSMGATESGDPAIGQRMKTLAVQMRVDGYAKLSLRADCLRRLRALSRQTSHLLAIASPGDIRLERLVNDHRLMESCARQASLEGGFRLPADGGEPRILAIARCLVAAGDLRLDKERLTMALAAFDDVQALNMAELWAAPTALKIALSEAFADLSMSMLLAARERLRAEEWIASGGRSPALKDCSSTFFERALQLAVERELPELRSRLEDHLLRRDETPSRVIRLAHEAQALSDMRLDHLVCTRRMLDTLNWQECFRLLSHTETELRGDPAAVYPHMDDASRAEIRAQVEWIARKTGLGEATVARHCANLAMEAMREYGQTDARSTVCWWLYEDEGRKALAARLGAAGTRLPAMVPDPSGKGMVAQTSALAALLLAAYIFIVESPLMYLYGIPLAWCAANLLLGAIVPKFLRPRRLLKLEFERLPPECATLLVMPALIPSAARGADLCDQLEALGCMDDDENTGYLLLGDFKDGDREHTETDAEILQCVRQRIQRMNDAAGREKYFYLHRNRVFYQPDGRWMGHERKRGAMMALNRVLLGQPGAAGAFAAEGSACARLAGRFPYVLTLDADTRLLPGTLHKLAGTLAHPLNRFRVQDGRPMGYALLQPNMELSAAAVKNRFIRLFGGQGGMDSYPVSISNLYQDMTGQGCFGGKGIYNVARFMDALEGALPDGRILSHDLIEGIFCRAGNVCDITLYDGFPSSLSAWAKRLNRWTRGDWQLLPYLFSKKPVPPEGKPMPAIHRMKLLDNLLRSLSAPALIALFTGAIWMDMPRTFALGVIYAFLSPLIRFLVASGEEWRRAAAHLAALPAIAATQIDAILRTLWRLAFTKRHMLDWVTAADAEQGSSALYVACRACAILLAPGLLRPAWIPATLALGALFLVSPNWFADLENQSTDSRGALRLKQIGTLSQLARETWRFFETYVDETGNHLPPDNVQLDPPLGPAMRTSPTNIGLYLLSCLAARELGFIRDEEMLRRMGDTMQTLLRMEKWNGHLFNWYDIVTLAPLKPRYVSSVDSGNLAACLLLCAQAVSDETLAGQMRDFARNMDFQQLYDSGRNLFVIGMDVEHNRLSGSHYDLLASESRILSMVGIMQGVAPIKHWFKLARPAVRLRDGQALVSWSGTMFEYLMPDLFLRAPSGSLLGESAQSVVRAQQVFAQNRQRPWGISESGYYAFDLHLNYQYRAFGLRQLALGGASAQEVVAPYASVLALSVCPAAVAENIDAMRQRNWSDDMGFYEAVDYAAGAPRLVKSHMAHHQGMALCALCNALTGDCLNRYFAQIPQARAISLLLEEKPAPRIRLAKREDMDAGRTERVLPQERGDRPAGGEQRLADVHLLAGAGATARLTAMGGISYVKDGVAANRFSDDFLRIRDGIFTHVRSLDSGECLVFGEDAEPASRRIRFDAGVAKYPARLGDVEMELTVSVSPEDGTLMLRIAARNQDNRSARLRFTNAFAAAVCPTSDMRAHPVFQGLFVESRRMGENALLLRRRPRSEKEGHAVLMHMVSGGENPQVETDLARLVGRAGGLSVPGGLEESLSGTVGHVLNPCCAISIDMNLRPGAMEQAHFCVGVLPPEEAEAWLARNAAEAAAERAEHLSVTRAKAMLDFLLLSPEKHHLLQRGSVFLLDARFLPREKTDRPQPGISRNQLWAVGISGDFPLITVCVSEAAHMAVVRDAIRAHEFYRSMGVWTELIVLCEEASDYGRPMMDALRELLMASHLGGMLGAPGGAFLMEAQQLASRQREALQRASAMYFGGEVGFWPQLRAMLAVTHSPGMPGYQGIPSEEFALPEVALEEYNGFGGFAQDGGAYVIDINPDVPPAPWSNILANEHFGALFTERGGGFAWHENSRNGRITPFDNDALSEGWGMMLYLADEKKGKYRTLLPGPNPDAPFRVTHAPSETRWESGTNALAFSVTAFVDGERPGLRLLATLRNTSRQPVRQVVTAYVDWAMGAESADMRFTRAWAREGVCVATGGMPGACFLACSKPAEAGADRASFLGHGGIAHPDGLMSQRGGQGGWALSARVDIAPGQTEEICFLLGWGEDIPAAIRYAQERAGSEPREILQEVRGAWRNRLEKLQIETPNPALNRMMNTFLPHQTLSARIRGRTGLYQPGGAYGFRDQLQDMLAMLPYEPERVRRHLLVSAERQFEEGDVLHWWHMPYTGVRTGIRDDCVFLPYVTARYVLETGDFSVLTEEIPYLENAPIPDGSSDLYAEMRPGNCVETLHQHCMRAFRRASQTGRHGLALMGDGDWNDGMNRVGNKGLGESVWLSEFVSACATLYAEISPSREDAAWLTLISAQMNAAVEEFGWDGEWYLRAYDDDGGKLGSGEGTVCRIDLISQAWAQLCGLDSMRCAQALTSAWRMLADEELGVIKLLTPPFQDPCRDPGYIKGYPAGIRENGAQYTHAACWMALALARQGDAVHAHRAVDMLLSSNHADTKDAALRYRVEPYVLAADIYTVSPNQGRGGWTWYTGAAGWLMQAVWRLVGYERRGMRVRICPLLNQWPEVALTLRHGGSEYRLVCRKDTRQASLDGKPLPDGWLTLQDDGGKHEALFPPHVPSQEHRDASERSVAWQ